MPAITALGGGPSGKARSPLTATSRRCHHCPIFQVTSWRHEGYRDLPLPKRHSHRPKGAQWPSDGSALRAGLSLSWERGSCHQAEGPVLRSLSAQSSAFNPRQCPVTFLVSSWKLPWTLGAHRTAPSPTPGVGGLLPTWSLRGHPFPSHPRLGMKSHEPWAHGEKPWSTGVSSSSSGSIGSSQALLWVHF